jgi:hypothetical protein
MTRDLLLTLLAMSPLILAGGILILALVRKPAQNERISPAAQASAHPDGAEQIRGSGDPDGMTTVSKSWRPTQRRHA